MGLSLGAAEARSILDADYRGPIVRGDLNAIGPQQQVVIIDGILDADQRLGIQEVLEALDRGVSIYGASSLGALLAVQLEHTEIKGRGQVFETLRALKQHSEHLSLQELIMTLYTSERFEQLTVPLIEPIAYCRKLGFSMKRLRKIARAFCEIPLDVRSWNNIKVVAENEGLILPDTPLLMNSKHHDACELLKSLKILRDPIFRKEQRGLPTTHDYG
ncbi:MAG: hypothetical protein KA735_00945 [Burkholderiaceae bacterium]|nr:hypothetical protein [Burkholderiaceae bacterium]